MQLNFQELWTYLKICLHFNAEIFFITLLHTYNKYMFKTHGLQIYILHHKNQPHVSYIITNTSSVQVLQFYTVLCLLSIPYLLTFFHT
jgi:hypothetical protein